MAFVPMQLKAWRKSPVAYFGTGHGAQLFAADGFMVLRTQEDNADKRELSYTPFGSCMNHGKSVFGGIVKVDGFPEFTAIPDNVYFLINCRVYRCPCPVDSGKRTGSFGLVDEYADHD